MLISAQIFLTALFLAALIYCKWRLKKGVYPAVQFFDEASSSLYREMQKSTVTIIPIRVLNEQHRKQILAKIERRFRTRAPYAFLHVTQAFNDSIPTIPKLWITKGGEEYLIEITSKLPLTKTVLMVAEALKAKHVFVPSKSPWILASNSPGANLADSVQNPHWHHPKIHLYTE